MRYLKLHFLRGMRFILGLIVGLSLGGLSLGGLSPVWAAGMPAAMTQAEQPAAPALSAQDYDALIKMLENPTARAALVQQLNTLSKEATAAPASASSAASAAEQLSITKQLTLDTSGAFQWLAQAATDAQKGISHLLNDAWFVIPTDELVQSAWRLGVLILLAYGLMFAAVQLLRPVSAQLAVWSNAASYRLHLIRAFASLAALGGLGFGILLLIDMLGHAVSGVLAQSGTYDLWAAALFLNAFLVLESARLVLRLILSPTYPSLRLFELSAPIAQFWARRITVLLRVLGYGLMFVVPLVRQWMGDDLAQLLVWGLALFGLIVSVQAILQQRTIIRAALLRRVDAQEAGLLGWLLRVVAHSWHWMMMGYIAMVFLVGLTRPKDALPFIAQASGYTVLAIAGGLLLSAILTQVFGQGVHLKAHHRRRVPMLERRLNSYLPWFVRILRFVIFSLTLALILSVWRIVDIFAWLGTNSGQAVLTTAIDIAFLLVIAVVIWLFVSSVVEAKLNSEHIPSARVQTLLSLFRNAIAVALVTVTAMMVLSELGVNIGPLLAGAGVLGLAIGFGAQKLVQDVITGIFIQLENAINKGDMVSVGGIMGTAENLSIRSVGIRDVSGTYHIVPFSAVTVVSNYMRGYAFHKAEYGISYADDIDAAIAQLRAAFDELMQDPEIKNKILEPIQVPGVTELGASSVNIRVLIKTLPGEQWAVGRAYNRLVKNYFDRSGIEIPFPQSKIHFAMDEPNPLLDAKNKPTLAAADKSNASASAPPIDEVPEEKGGKQ